MEVQLEWRVRYFASRWFISAYLLESLDLLATQSLANLDKLGWLPKTLIITGASVLPYSY
jgi:hypothetical protein